MAAKVPGRSRLSTINLQHTDVYNNTQMDKRTNASFTWKFCHQFFIIKVVIVAFLFCSVLCAVGASLHCRTVGWFSVGGGLYCCCYVVAVERWYGCHCRTGVETITQPPLFSLHTPEGYVNGIAAYFIYSLFVLVSLKQEHEFVYCIYARRH